MAPTRSRFREASCRRAPLPPPPVFALLIALLIFALLQTQGKRSEKALLLGSSGEAAHGAGLASFSADTNDLILELDDVQRFGGASRAGSVVHSKPEEKPRAIVEISIEAPRGEQAPGGPPQEGALLAKAEPAEGEVLDVP